MPAGKVFKLEYAHLFSFNAGMPLEFNGNAGSNGFPNNVLSGSIIVWLKAGDEFNTASGTLDYSISGIEFNITP